jgi:hypothetical protein
MGRRDPGLSTLGIDGDLTIALSVGDRTRILNWIGAATQRHCRWPVIKAVKSADGLARSSRVERPGFNLEIQVVAGVS